MYSPWGLKESDTTEQLSLSFSSIYNNITSSHSNKLTSLKAITKNIVSLHIFICLFKYICTCWWLSSKESACQCWRHKRCEVDPWIRKICWRRDRLLTPVFLGFPGGSAGKESVCNVGDLGSISGLGRSPGEGKGYPLQYSGLETSINCIVHGVPKNWTRLSNFHFHFHGVQGKKHKLE